MKPRTRPGWLIPVIIGFALLIIGIVWWNRSSTKADLPNAPTLAGNVPTNAPVTVKPILVPSALTTTATIAPIITIVPTATVAPAPAITPAVTVTNSNLESTPLTVTPETVTATAVLPTITPVPVATDSPSRTVTVDGAATLHVMIANSVFQASGQPLALPIEPRTYHLGVHTPTITDQWCLQLGIVNLQFKLTLNLVPIVAGVAATGSIELYDDYCAAPGQRRDMAGVDLTVPANATAQITHNLRSKRELLKVPDLLDTDNYIDLELHISNAPTQ